MRRRGLLFALVLWGACDGPDTVDPGTPLLSTGSRLQRLRPVDLQLRADGSFSQEPLFDSDGRSPDLVGITLVAQTRNSGRFSLGVVDDSARVLIDAANPEGSPNRMLSGREWVVAHIPSATATASLAKNFSMTARWLANPPSDAAVLIAGYGKYGPGGGGVPQFQELRVRVVGFARGFPTNDRLSSVMAVVRRIWRTAGVELIELSREQWDDPDATSASAVAVDPSLGSDSPALGRLLRLSARFDDDGALTVFVVPNLSLAGGSGLWALSGGIPVPPKLGTPRSGLVIHGDAFALPVARAGQILAHEIGHALGLFHSTEGALVLRPGSPPQTISDQIDDTVTCPASANVAPADGTLSFQECRDFDAGNLMFFAGGENSTTLTPGQADIARRSALTR